jgi:hypothetical protein
MRTVYCVQLLAIILLLGSTTGPAAEQMEQETIVIKGNQELPKTLYIAPWKRVGAPLDSGQVQVEIGEEAEPVERDLFLHELELNRQGYSTGEPSPVAPVSAPPSVKN